MVAISDVCFDCILNLVADTVDLLRCSITFETCKEFREALTKFTKIFEDDNSGDNNNENLKDRICIRKILRIKNGFKKTKRWTTSDDYGYVDVKMNVVVSDGKKRTIIGEIQLS